MYQIECYIPKWMETLPQDHEMKQTMIDGIHLGVRQLLNMFKQFMTQFRRKSGGCLCSKILGGNRTYQTNQAQCDQYTPHLQHINAISLSNTMVNNSSHNKRHKQFKRRFQQFEQRCQNRLFFIISQIL